LGAKSPGKLNACDTAKQALNRYPVASRINEGDREKRAWPKSSTAVIRSHTTSAAWEDGMKAQICPSGCLAKGTAARKTRAETATAMKANLRSAAAAARVLTKS